jgi:hypothetical protein
VLSLEDERQVEGAGGARKLGKAAENRLSREVESGSAEIFLGRAKSCNKPAPTTSDCPGLVIINYRFIK